MAVVGVGQTLNGDDAAGVLVAQGLLKRQRAITMGTLVPKRLFSRDPQKRPVSLIIADRQKYFWNQRPLLFVIEAAHAPENCTGAVRRFAPDLVILVDAAEMGDPPGTVRWLDWRDTSGLGASTHSLPPSMVARYLAAELSCQVALIGIQVQDTSLGARVSPPVRRAIRTVSEGLKIFLLDAGDKNRPEGA